MFSFDFRNLILCFIDVLRIELMVIVVLRCWFFVFIVWGFLYLSGKLVEFYVLVGFLIIR